MRKALRVMLGLVLCVSLAGAAMTGGVVAQDAGECDADERQSGDQQVNQDCEGIQQYANAENDVDFNINQENEIDQENELDADESQRGAQSVEDNEQENEVEDVEQENENEFKNFEFDAEAENDAEIDDDDDDQDND